MLNKVKKAYYGAGAGFSLGMLSAQDALAQNNFNQIAENITNSIEDVPNLLAALAYLFGILLGVLGVLKIKDHVENPTQTPLKDGAIRLAAGGALFALPILYEAMSSTIDQDGSGAGAGPASLNRAGFNVGP